MLILLDKDFLMETSSLSQQLAPAAIAQLT